MNPAWVEGAKGIPVWVGASIYKTPGGYVGTAYQVGTVLVYGMCHKDASGFRLDWRDECVPDLADPDTRAAYLRRLAVALGAEPHHADSGVTVGWTRGVLMVWAGIPDTGAEPGDIVFKFERMVTVPKDADKTTALALAWPADKRVTT